MRFLLAAGVAASVGLSVVGGSHPASAATTSPTNWTQWGFNAQHTGYNSSETVLTRANVGHLVSVFSTRLKGAFPDPIVANGVVYLANSNGIIEAIDGATGAYKWRVGPICYGGISDPAFANGRVWVGQEDPGLAGITTSGNKVVCITWNAAGIDSSPPSVGHGTVYVAGDYGTLGALDVKTGAVRWGVGLPQDQGQEFDASPALSADGGAVFVGGSEYIGNGQSYNLVYKVNAATGAVIWSRNLGTCFGPNSTVSVSGSMVFVAGCVVYALSAATGATIWSSAAVEPDTVPAVAGGLVFVSGYGGTVALKAGDGSLVWQNPAYSYSAPYLGELAIANGVVYVGSDMLNSSTGAFLGALPPLPSGVSYTGAVIPVDGRVYVCSQNSSTGVVSLDAYTPRS
jgi:outer membrane protein assembly factor BamB